MHSLTSLAAIFISNPDPKIRNFYISVRVFWRSKSKLESFMYGSMAGVDWGGESIVNQEAWLGCFFVNF